MAIKRIGKILSVQVRRLCDLKEVDKMKKFVGDLAIKKIVVQEDC